MLLPTLSLSLVQPRGEGAPSVAAFGIYSHLSAMAPTTRYGVLVIVRRASVDGSTITDIGTFPAPPAAGRAYKTYLLSRGRIVRDADGSTVKMELRATGDGPNGPSLLGSSVWERSNGDGAEKSAPDAEAKPSMLKGEMNSAVGGKRSGTLPGDAFYSLGIVEALTFNPTVADWQVPSVGGMYRVFTASPRQNTATSYHLRSGHEGVYWFENRATRLRVCPVTFDGEPDKVKLNGRLVSTNVRALVLFDASGRLVGLGPRGFLSEDIESIEGGGHTGDMMSVKPAYPTAPDPFADDLCPVISRCLAREDLSPAQAAAYLRAMG